MISQQQMLNDYNTSGTNIYWDDNDRSISMKMWRKQHISDEEIPSIGSILKQYYDETNPLHLYGEYYETPRLKKIQKLPRFLYTISDLTNKNNIIKNSELYNKNLDPCDTDNSIATPLCVNINENDKNVNQLNTVYNDDYFQTIGDSDDEFNADILEHISYKNNWYS